MDKEEVDEAGWSCESCGLANLTKRMYAKAMECDDALCLSQSAHGVICAHKVNVPSTSVIHVTSCSRNMLTTTLRHVNECERWNQLRIHHYRVREGGKVSPAAQTPQTREITNTQFKK